MIDLSTSKLRTFFYFIDDKVFLFKIIVTTDGEILPTEILPTKKRNPSAKQALERLKDAAERIQAKKIASIEPIFFKQNSGSAEAFEVSFSI